MYDEDGEILVLKVLEQHNKPIEKEKLFEEVKLMQEKENMQIYNIKQRTPEHFYCPEIGVELQKMVFRELITLKVKWEGRWFEEYYKITDFGKEIFQESMTQRAMSIKEEIEGGI